MFILQKAIQFFSVRLQFSTWNLSDFVFFFIYECKILENRYNKKKFILESCIKKS